MRLLKTLLLLAVAVVGALFFLQNQGVLAHRIPVRLQLPRVELLPFPPDGPRIDVLLLLTFVIGSAFGWLSSTVRRVRGAFEIRRLRRRLADAEARLAEQKSSAASESVAATPTVPAKFPSSDGAA